MPAMSKLLSLPLEIREIIYEELHTTPPCYDVYYCSSPFPIYYTLAGLALCCRQLGQEVLAHALLVLRKYIRELNKIIVRELELPFNLVFVEPQFLRRIDIVLPISLPTEDWFYRKAATDNFETNNSSSPGNLQAQHLYLAYRDDVRKTFRTFKRFLNESVTIHIHLHVDTNTITKIHRDSAFIMEELGSQTTRLRIETTPLGAFIHTFIEAVREVYSVNLILGLVNARGIELDWDFGQFKWLTAYYRHHYWMMMQGARTLQEQFDAAQIYYMRQYAPGSYVSWGVEDSRIVQQHVFSRNRLSGKAIFFPGYHFKRVCREGLDYPPSTII
ncbi:hypothetical protein EJ04DRAFT_558326 [Polyplosphaeria fusca]|uniref:Uncharacterized protein n=1 Tax=Polyplosphaeria fusca TaxID=682080 RepID=A0A9P4RA54_9PLEO|nr:hypothetical protein EJ04DRAFT_558326 [Polyplosphaeria fusca]